MDAASNSESSATQWRELRAYSEVESVPVCVRKHGIPSTFPRRTQCQREKGLRNGKAEAPPVFSILVALFRIFGNATRGLSEDPKTHQVAHWRWRFFGSRGKKTIGGSVLNASPPSDGLTKRRKCFSAAAASSGLAPVQDRANVVKAVRRQSAFEWVFGMPYSKACI